MKKTRLAVLGLLIAAIGVVAAGYFITQKRNQLLAPAKPSPIPEHLNSVAKNWSWSRSSKESPVVQVRAKDWRQAKDTARIEMTEVELKVFDKSGSSYDLIRSQKAEFDQTAERLSSEGEVTIILGLRTDPGPERPVEVRTSGLTYDSKLGVSTTDRPVHFRFEDGEGDAVGALYDAGKRFLWLKSNVTLIGAGKQARMKIHSSELHYYEAEQKIELRPPSRIERGHQGVEATHAIVFMDKGQLKRVEAQQGKGWDLGDTRQVRFSGASLEANFGPDGSLVSAVGNGNAQLVAESRSGATHIGGERIDLMFATPPGSSESELHEAHVRGHGRVESAPLALPDRPQAEGKVLTAEWVKLTMRPGGEDVEKVETLSPGALEFVPQLPAQWRRTLTADHLEVLYQPENRPEKLVALGNAHLRSVAPEGAPKGRMGAPPPRLTWSDNLEASFEPKSGQMRELRQWSNFRYEEGPRKARAGSARFDVAEDRVTLDTAARVWDDTSTVEANRVVLDQGQDRLTAEGRVASTQQGGQRGQGTSLFASSAPVHATAQKMESIDRNRLLHYSGGARLWQEGNSVQARDIELDRGERTLQARGDVVSVLVDDERESSTKPAPVPKPAAAGPSKASSGLVTIAAERLLYTDSDRRAFYTGHVVLRRDRMTIRAGELETFLRPQEDVRQGESRLERALARGKVEILETAAGQTAARRGSAEQADYSSGDEKVILRGGQPTLEQPGRGFTRGAELTYYINGDRLLVNGRPGARSQSRRTLEKH